MSLGRQTWTYIENTDSWVRRAKQVALCYVSRPLTLRQRLVLPLTLGQLTTVLCPLTFLHTNVFVQVPTVGKKHWSPVQWSTLMCPMSITGMLGRVCSVSVCMTLSECWRHWSNPKPWLVLVAWRWGVRKEAFIRLQLILFHRLSFQHHLSHCCVQPLGSSSLFSCCWTLGLL